MAVERQKHNKTGESGFYHFYGVVENRLDEGRLGRVQVRIYGDHTENLSELPSSSLPWAMVILPVTAAPNTSHNLWDGTLVFGYYADGIEKQVPVIVGQIAKDGKTTLDPAGVKTEGFQDQREALDCSVDGSGKSASVGINTSPAANHENYKASYQATNRIATKLTIGTYKEPASTYAAKYPFNRAEETESGHLIEKDDTPGQERLCITHRTGSYVEFLKDGSVLYKSNKDKHDITSKAKYDAIGGTYNRTVGGKVIDKVLGGYDLAISGGNLTINVAGSVSIKAIGTFNVDASTINLSAGTINLN